MLDTVILSNNDILFAYKESANENLIHWFCRKQRLCYIPLMCCFTNFCTQVDVIGEELFHVWYYTTNLTKF